MYEFALQFIAVNHATLWAIDITTLAVALIQLVIGLAPRWKAPLLSVLGHRSHQQQMRLAAH